MSYSAALHKALKGRLTRICGVMSQFVTEHKATLPMDDCGSVVGSGNSEEDDCLFSSPDYVLRFRATTFATVRAVGFGDRLARGMYGKAVLCPRRQSRKRLSVIAVVQSDPEKSRESAQRATKGGCWYLSPTAIAAFLY